jgi:hypothetical protein
MNGKLLLCDWSQLSVETISIYLFIVICFHCVVLLFTISTTRLFDCLLTLQSFVVCAVMIYFCALMLTNSIRWYLPCKDFME